MSELLRKILGVKPSGTPEAPPSDLGDVVEGVTPHSHCRKCAKAITLGKTFCSAVCKGGEKKKGSSSFFWIIMLMMLMLLMLNWK